MELKPFFRAFQILLTAAVLLLVFPLIQERLPWLKDHTRSYDFFARFRRQAGESTKLQALTDTLPPEIAAYDGRDFLQSFYRLLRSGDEQVRIAHFGDSSIEGDLITGSLRDSLQRRFGGSGIGWAALVNPIAGFRRTLRQRSSANWYHVYLGKENAQGLPRGPTGEYISSWQPPDTTVFADSLKQVSDTAALRSLAEETYRFSFGTTSFFPGTRIFPTARLFYGAVRPDSTGAVAAPGILYSSTGEQWMLDGNALLNVAQLSREPRRQFNLEGRLPESQALYGISFESSEGVIVDNFPSRGNSGSGLTQISSAMLRAFQQEVDYDLILLQFGLNSLNPEMLDYSWYTQEMIRVIRHVQAAMPGVAILVIGPSDRAIKVNGRMLTDPSVPRITAALREAARQTQCAFFSLFEAMGGEGSIIEWVEQRQPRMANLDYTHFNFEGADEAGRLLLEFLLGGMDERISQSKRKTNPRQ